MAEELENKSQETQQDPKQESSREGYTHQGGYQKDYHPSTGRTQRPRIHTQRPYSADHSTSSEEGGFRPAGFGSGLAGGQNQRPQQRGYQRQGGYQPRPRYNANQEGGYQPRPRYNSYNQEGKSFEGQQGGYQPRQGGYHVSRVVTSLVSRVAISPVSRVVTSLVSKVAISPVSRVVTSVRAVMAVSRVATSVRAVMAVRLMDSARAMIPMPSTALRSV